MARLKDNPIPIELNVDDLDDLDGYEDFLKMGALAQASLTAEYEKTLADSAVAVAKADLVEASREMLEKANDMTRWNWDGDAS